LNARFWALGRPAPEYIALAAGAAALLIVHVAQSAGLVPCALCYLERWPYRLAIVLALLAIGWRSGRAAIRPVLIAVFLAAAALALIHVGVEFHWWKSPLPECAAPILRTGSIKDMLASMPAHPAKPCDDPTYLVPGLPLSMAQANLIYALASAAIVAICSPWTRSAR
jgi:disulfide bond formation protein DsbB